MNFLDVNEEYEVIPWNVHITKFYSVTFEGFSFPIDINDPTFIKTVSFAGENINSFIRNNKNECAFREPQLSLKPDGTLTAKLGMIEKYRLKELLDE